MNIGGDEGISLQSLCPGHCKRSNEVYMRGTQPQLVLSPRLVLSQPHHRQYDGKVDSYSARTSTQLALILNLNRESYSPRGRDKEASASHQRARDEQSERPASEMSKASEPIASGMSKASDLQAR